MASASFATGAWVRATDMDWFGGIERNPVTGKVRYVPTAGEIIGTGKLGHMPVYSVKFGGSRGFVCCDAAACYICLTRDDSVHAEGCCAVALRGLPHEAGFAPDTRGQP